MIYKQEGEVIAVNNNFARVRLSQPCSVDKCASCGLCSSGANQALIPELEVKFSKAPKIGDKVCLRVNMPNQGLVAIVVFGLPLTGVLVGGYCGTMLKASLGNAGIILGGLIGFTAGFGLVWLINNKLKFLHASAEWG